jgi:hypothetical protein
LCLFLHLLIKMTGQACPICLSQSSPKETMSSRPQDSPLALLRRPVLPHLIAGGVNALTAINQEPTAFPRIRLGGDVSSGPGSGEKGLPGSVRLAHPGQHLLLKREV